MVGAANIVGFLVVHLADANAGTHEGDRPLFMAAYKSHAEVTRLLLAGGAQWDAVDPGGRDALWVAGMKGHDEIVELLEAKAAAPGRQLPDVH